MIDLRIGVCTDLGAGDFPAYTRFFVRFHERGLLRGLAFLDTAFRQDPAATAAGSGSVDVAAVAAVVVAVAVEPPLAAAAAAAAAADAVDDV